MHELKILLFCSWRLVKIEIFDSRDADRDVNHYDYVHKKINKWKIFVANRTNS